jgi:serine/threonine protein kinase
VTDPAHDPDSLIGTRVASYRVESLVGIGAMGHVYRALDDDDRAVALKIVRPEIAHEDVYRRRFLREAMIAQQVKDLHVVPVLELGEHDGVPYLVQPFIEGGSLADKLAAERRLPASTVLPICREVAQGLDALFAGGMVHRDVKPANVMLDPDGTAHITDFGLAKVLEGSLLTRPGQALGSLDYMAPEQIRGETVSAATDVYSLGCVTYECFAGAPPFAHRLGMRVIMAQISEAPPDLSSKSPELSAELAAAVMSALEKDPADRPSSAGEFARRLTEVQAGAS